MTTEKLVWMLIPLTLSVIAIVLGFKSYSIGLRNDIRVKYHRFLGQSGVESMMEKEYVQGISRAITLFIVFTILLGALSYLVVLVIKNDIPLM